MAPGAGATSPISCPAQRQLAGSIVVVRPLITPLLREAERCGGGRTG